MLNVFWIHSFDFKVNGSGTFIRRMADVMSKHVNLTLIPTGNITTPAKFLSSYNQIKTLTKNSDIIHSQYGSGCGALCSFLPNKNKVITLRGSDYYYQYDINPITLFRSLITGTMTRLVLSKFNRIIVVSEAMKQKLLKTPNVTVIPSPLPKSFKPDSTKDESRSILGYHGDKRFWVIFSTVQRNNHIKRENLARNAISIIKDQNIALFLLNNINEKEMRHWVNASNLILLTSKYEGWPNIIKEGLACNVPFVSTRVSDLESITNDTPHCRITKPETVSIANNILDAYSERNNIFNFEKYCNQFNIELLTNNLLKVYYDLYENN